MALPPLAYQALDIVLRDAPAGCDVRLSEEREYEYEDPIPMIWLGPSGSMLHVEGETLPAFVVAIADMLQEMLIEARFYASGHASPWPECPLHPNAHPLQARQHDGSAWWICPRDQGTQKHIGS